MSAYALPGLFPPLPFENNIGISSCGSQDYQTSSEKADFKQPLTDGYSRPWSPPVEISLKEAKIDALQLIQSLTKTASAATTTQQQSKKRGQRLLKRAFRNRKHHRTNWLCSLNSTFPTTVVNTQWFEACIAYDNCAKSCCRSNWRTTTTMKVREPPMTVAAVAGQLLVGRFQSCLPCTSTGLTRTRVSLFCMPYFDPTPRPWSVGCKSYSV
jgi:hypothetical protein